jgi:hypothetical protein
MGFANPGREEGGVHFLFSGGVAGCCSYAIVLVEEMCYYPFWGAICAAGY